MINTAIQAITANDAQNGLAAPPVRRIRQNATSLECSVLGMPHFVAGKCFIFVATISKPGLHLVHHCREAESDGLKSTAGGWHGNATILR